MSNGFHMGKMMKQLQKVQEDISRVQRSLGEKTVQASAGGGAIKVVVSGDFQVKSITIDPDLVNPEDLDMLQDTIVAAVNEGLRLAQKMVSDEMSKVTGGIKLPGF